MRRIGAIILICALLLGFGPRPGAKGAGAAPTGRIAYQGSDRALHLVGADGFQDRVVPTRGAVYTPRWSPTGGQLAYSDELATAPYKGQLVIINPDSGAARVLVEAEARDLDMETYWSYAQPRWTPDGAAVVYIRSGGGRVTTIMRVAAAGSTPTELFYGTSTTRFDLSPTDGRFVVSDDAFAEERVQGSALTILDPDGGNARLLLPRGGGFYFQPNWTPDGTGILVRHQTARDSKTATLVLVDAATGARRTLGAVAGGSSFTPSPDGSWLAVAAGDTKRLALISLGDFGDGPLLGQGAAPSWEPLPTSRHFPQTGFRIQGRFLTFWQAHGALPLYGYPLTDERRETLDDGRVYTVQYFERARLEYHPENADSQYQILLGQFGRRIHPADPAVARRSGTTYFSETGHHLEGRFLRFWQGNGGLAQFGYPLSEELTETLEDGRPYLVQYFERSRFEYHPENSDPQYQVMLGQFGRRILNEGSR